MERFEIQPVFSSTLPEAARFLHRQLGEPANRRSFQSLGREDGLSLEERLRWLLLGNPLTRDDSHHGYCVRDTSGIVRGLTLCFPSAFLAGNQRILGLGSGSLFVELQARTAGFYLFKKYLSSPGYSFFFSTTCNPNSAALFRQLGGSPVSNSTPEYVLPIKLDTLLPALVAGKTMNGTLSAIARLAGRCANPILRLFERQSAELSIAPCRDWRKLSDLFRRYRPKDRITTDRSVEFLQWRYGQHADLYPSGVYLFRDKRGNEGWFSLGTMIRGRRGQIRGSVLLDAIWPREKMSFGEVFPAILQMVTPHADALFFWPRPGLDYSECSPWIIPRRWASPSVFAITRKSDPRLDVASLDLAYADGDGALPVSPMDRVGSDARMGSGLPAAIGFASPAQAARLR
jgi:hypothetical protein